jgi:hypothetical protein
MTENYNKIVEVQISAVYSRKKIKSSNLIKDFLHELRVVPYKSNYLEDLSPECRPDDVGLKIGNKFYIKREIIEYQKNLVLEIKNLRQSQLEKNIDR